MQSFLISQFQAMPYEEQVALLRGFLSALSDRELGTAIELARQEQVRRAPMEPLPAKLFR